MKLTLRAKSSSGGSYDVEFVGDSTAIRVVCHCQAGVLRQVCKHKLGLIRGDAKLLFDTPQTEMLMQLQTWPGFEELRRKTSEYDLALAQIEAAKSELAKEEKRIKAAFASGLANGFK